MGASTYRRADQNYRANHLPPASARAIPCMGSRLASADRDQHFRACAVSKNIPQSERDNRSNFSLRRGQGNAVTSE
jgi:hypothetical protein